MTEKLYYWAENLENYTSDNDNETGYDEVIEIKRLNFFIGKNNAGKSRFIRELFKTIQGQQLYNSLQFRKIQAFKKKLIQSKQYNDTNTNYIQLLDTINEIKPSNIGAANSNFPQALDYLSRIGQLSSLYSNNNKSIATSMFSKEIELNLNPIFTRKKFYIPILRGMRPVTDQENKYPYIERAQKDYFKNQNKYNKENIITGERLYYELKVHLLGEPKQRELIQAYQEKLSQYFFDNEPVTLIPKFGTDEFGNEIDVVHIKIGKDEQFAIYNLGDGLQQAIILTYEAFINKDETHAFFVEEPELHMHAGMVRQLMNFYLNETSHYYFFTTHSNHLLDMADESEQVMIQKIVKQPKLDDPTKFNFKIYRCDRDRDLLASLGVRPSSVYLANCTIWVEGITDRLYITKYMKKYLEIVKQEEALEVEGKSNNLKSYKYISSDIQRLMPNYHYTFVEYAGSNLTHWDFSDEFADHLDDRGLNALLTTSSVLLIADGDIKNKSNRVEILEKNLGDKFLLLECKETENTLPSNIIHYTCRIKFLGLNDAFQDDETKRNALSNHLSRDGMQSESKCGFDISKLDITKNYFHIKNGIGKIIDDQIKDGELRTADGKPKKCFSDKSGTIKEKLKFCRLVLTVMDHVEWELTPSAKEICEKIFEHIITENPLTNKKTA